MGWFVLVSHLQPFSLVLKAWGQVSPPVSYRSRPKLMVGDIQIVGRSLPMAAMDPSRRHRFVIWEPVLLYWSTILIIWNFICKNSFLHRGYGTLEKLDHEKDFSADQYNDQVVEKIIGLNPQSGLLNLLMTPKMWSMTRNLTTRKNLCFLTKSSERIGSFCRGEKHKYPSNLSRHFYIEQMNWAHI